VSIFVMFLGILVLLTWSSTIKTPVLFQMDANYHEAIQPAPRRGCDGCGLGHDWLGEGRYLPVQTGNSSCAAAHPSLALAVLKA
jgi:hypothetical protein